VGVGILTGEFVTLAKNLRRRSTDAERLLWHHLRGRQLEGFKFRRQEPIGNYIADFVCFSKKIIVELDGGQHAIEADKDFKRDSWFEGQGFKVLRFWSNEVLVNIEGVIETLLRELVYSP
jgi:very-short-patch-repair endonuclease